MIGCFVIDGHCHSLTRACYILEKTISLIVSTLFPTRPLLSLFFQLYTLHTYSELITEGLSVF